MELMSLELFVALSLALVAIFGKATLSLGGQGGRATGRVRADLPDGAVIDGWVSREAVPTPPRKAASTIPRRTRRKVQRKR